MDIGLLLLRAVVGLTLAAHGAQKLFGWFGGHGLTATGEFLEKIGFVPGWRHAFLAGLIETGAGLLLALGLLTPLAAAGIVAVMLTAGLSVHRTSFFLTNGGYEYTLVLGAAAAAVAFTGPGAWSLDALLGLPGGSVPIGAAALAAGLVGGGGSVLGRRPQAA